MSAKNVDRYNRFRNITVGFRMSPEENEQLNRAVALSGLQKQEYCYMKCMNRDISVTPNPRIFKMMTIHMKDILMELRRLSQGDNPSTELLEDIELITQMLNDMKEERK